MRIRPGNKNDYPYPIRLIFWLQKRKYGQVLDPTRLWGLSPKVLLGLQVLYLAITRKNSPIESSLRSLISVRVSQLNNCSFCMDINSAFLEKEGISKDKIISLHEHEKTDHFTTREKLALTYAEVITRTGETVTDTLFSNLLKHFTEKEIIELTAIISYQNLSSKFNAALDVPSQGFAQFNNKNSNTNY